MCKYNLVEEHYKALVLNTIYVKKYKTLVINTIYQNNDKALFYEPKPMVRGLGYKMGRC